MPREIPAVTSNMNVNMIPNFQHPVNMPYGYYQQQFMPPPQPPWRTPVQTFGMTTHNLQPQFQLLNSPQPRPIFRNQSTLGSGYIFNQSMYPVPPYSQPRPQIPSISRQIPSTSRQIVPDVPVASSYREHRLMKQKEEQRRQEEERRKRQEHLLLKQNEERQERERNIQKEQDQNVDKPDKVSNFKIRQQQIADYNKREFDEQASTSSKQSESGKSGNGSKKSVKWADESNKSVSDSGNKSCDNSSAKSSEKSSGSSKAQTSSNKEKATAENSKVPKKDTKAAAANKKVNAPKNNIKAVKTVKAVESSKSKSSDNKVKNKTEKSTNQEADGKICKLKVIHAKPQFKLLQDVDNLFKRKSDSPVKDDNQSKRTRKDSKSDNNEPDTSNYENIKIKEEVMSDDENLDGKTDVSSNNDNAIVPEVNEICIKQEPEEDLNGSVSTVENIEIKEEVMSTIDDEKSSVHSEKLDVKNITENFVKACENSELYNIMDFSQFENLTEDALNNNNDEIMLSPLGSQDKCASWLEDVKNSDYFTTIESQNHDQQFYLTKDEEVEPDDDIVPYFPARQLGAPEITPKEEEQ
ncbi:uncharacterized protein [Chironomus tepperi]